jgi:hypothetical protein
MAVARHPANKALGDEYVARIYETIASMNPNTRQLFQQLEIQISHCEDRKAIEKRYIPLISDPICHIFRKLTGLERLIVSFDPKSAPPRTVQGLVLDFYQEKYESDIMEWLIDHIPESMNVSWDHADASRFFGSVAVEQRLWRTVQDKSSAGTGKIAAQCLESARSSSVHVSNVWEFEHL